MEIEHAQRDRVWHPNQAPIIQEATGDPYGLGNQACKKVPQSTDEMKDLITAFAKNDPDGNGKADTFGFGFAKVVLVGPWRCNLLACQTSGASNPMAPLRVRMSLPR